MLAHALVLGCQLAVKVHIVGVQPVGQVHSWHQQVILRFFFIPSSSQRSADVKSSVSLAWAQSMQVQGSAFDAETWAAQYNTWLLIRSTPTDMIFSSFFPLMQSALSKLSLFYTNFTG